MTRLTDALACLADIHAHLARGEVYRGLQARPVLASGLLGLAFAMVQLQWLPLADATLYTWYWLLAAGCCALVGISGAVLHYVMEEDPVARRRARIVAGQFVPCVVAGCLLPLALLPQLEQVVGLLPGSWALLYALGLFSTRPYLPRATGWVGLYFLLAGALLLSFSPRNSVPSPWAIASVFSLGQMGLAWVLHRNEERENAHA
jgi:hypothetical protein